jgi:2-methylcitrate dehydratase PrpD
MFSARVPSRVTITTNNGVLTRTVLDPKGEPANPMSWRELVEKLETAAQDHGRDFSNALTDSVVALGAGDRDALRTILGRPLEGSA